MGLITLSFVKFCEIPVKKNPGFQSPVVKKGLGDNTPEHKLFEKAVNPGTTSWLNRRNIYFPGFGGQHITFFVRLTGRLSHVQPDPDQNKKYMFRDPPILVFFLENARKPRKNKGFSLRGTPKILGKERKKRTKKKGKSENEKKKGNKKKTRIGGSGFMCLLFSLPR